MRERRAARKGPWKLVQNGEDPPELYNLDEDVGESHDLACLKTDRLEKLSWELSRWEEEVKPR
jgi:arylsulfatase A-like enzyme